jgi:hypothetical protein
MNKMENSVVYWIHRPCHTDITKQGYVGITKNPVSRWAEHKRKAKTNGKATIYKAMRKYADVQFDVILIGDRKYCEEIEIKLRPQHLIGWNIAIGGEDATKGATLKSQEAYLSRRIANADYYWYRTEIALLKTLHNKKKKADKAIAYTEHRAKIEPTINHGKRKHDVRNTSGYTGVGWYPKYQLWRSQICIDKRYITLGYYKTPQEAHQSYLIAKAHVPLFRSAGLDLKAFRAIIKKEMG